VTRFVLQFTILLSEERLNIVESLVLDSTLRQSLRTNHLNRLPDLQRLGGRLQRRRAGLQDCYRLYQAVRLLPDLLETLETSEASAQQRTLFAELFCNPLQVFSFNFVIKLGDIFLALCIVTMFLKI